jgi:hypothetical protein
MEQRRADLAAMGADHVQRRKTIDKVVIYSVQDNYASPIQPNDSTTFSLWGVVNFNVQAWNGTSWYTVASIAGNNLVKRTVASAP